MRTGSRRHRISTVFQILGRRADSLRIGRYTNFLDTTQRGENYTVFGAWKVYTNVEQALATFESYRACTQHLTHVYQQGHSLAKLAQATR
ncbi:DUF3793 family protein [Collinsella sp. LCP19S3_B7]|uniref:DUF3793 family protein n=1 Tax=Collinsella sp. LCP19S3_B7 TaxID=3438756 RepID=UPI003F8F2412